MDWTQQGNGVPPGAGEITWSAPTDVAGVKPSIPCSHRLLGALLVFVVSPHYSRAFSKHETLLPVR